MYSLMGLTWNNIGAYSETSYASQDMGNVFWAAFDITNLAKDWKNGTQNPQCGFVLVSDSTTRRTATYAAEYGTADNRPYVVVNYNNQLTVTPSGVTMYVGEDIPLTAISNPAGQAVTWESDAPTVASVDENGVVTGLSAGNATITATLDAVTFASCEIEVRAKTINFDHYNGVTLQVYKGNVITLVPRIEPSGEEVEWISLNPTIASVNQAGEVNGVSPGFATIRASLNNGAFADYEVEVLPNEVDIERDDIQIVKDPDKETTVSLSIETVPPGLPVTWSTSDSTIATVSNTGIVTALKAGDVTITANLADGTSDSCVVKVRYLGQFAQYEIETDDGTFLELVLLPQVAENVTWSTSDADIATVNASGRVYCINPGNVTITANSPDLLNPISCDVTIRFGTRLYWIQNTHNDLRLTSQSIRIKDNTTVVQDQDNASRSELNYLTQLWRITHVGNGYYTIRPVFKLSMALFVDDSKNVLIKEIGTQDLAHEVPAEALWKITRDGNNYRFECAKYSNLYMMPFSSAAGPRSKIVCEDDGTNPACMWNFSGMSIVPRAILYNISTGKPLKDRRIGILINERRSLVQMDICASIAANTGYHDPVWSTDDSDVAFFNSDGNLFGNGYGVTTVIATPDFLGSTVSSSQTIVVSKIRITGYELEYNPEYWNETPVQRYGTIRNHTNCYAYAINCQIDPINNNFGCNFNGTDTIVAMRQQPGDLYNDNNSEGVKVSPLNDSAVYSVDKVFEASRKDFEIFNLRCGETSAILDPNTEGIPVGAYKVYLAIKPGGPGNCGDYHWYRQNPDGTWSHKRGAEPVINTVHKDSTTLIWDPAEAAKEIGYTMEGRYLVVIPWNKLYAPTDTNYLNSEPVVETACHLEMNKTEPSNDSNMNLSMDKIAVLFRYENMSIGSGSFVFLFRKTRRVC